MRHSFLLLVLFFVCVVFAGVVPAIADSNPSGGSNSQLSLPRFVSMRSGKAYSRTGPAIKYPVRWVYVKECLPVEITKEYETWRKIRDSDGKEGWVHKSLLSGRRTVIIEAGSPVPMLKDGDQTKVIAEIEPGAILDVKECTPLLCLLESQGFSGWVERNKIWGIYQDEELH